MTAEREGGTRGEGGWGGSEWPDESGCSRSGAANAKKVCEREWGNAAMGEES